MGGGAFFFFAAAIVIGAFLLIRDMIRKQHERDYMIRMRNSMLFREMYPMLQYVRRFALEEIRVERGGVSYYGLYPACMLENFMLEEWNFQKMTPRQVRALALLLAEELAPLQNREWYKLQQYKVERPNGQKDIAYRYIVTHKYKARLVYAIRWSRDHG